MPPVFCDPIRHVRHRQASLPTGALEPLPLPTVLLPPRSLVSPLDTIPRTTADTSSAFSITLLNVHTPDHPKRRLTCGNKSNPLTLSTTHLPPPRFSASRTNHPTSRAWVCTLQLTYTIVCGANSSSWRRKGVSHPFLGGWDISSDRCRWWRLAGLDGCGAKEGKNMG